MATSKGKIRVSGTCKAGHTTETVSDKGRVTWSGPCSHSGCEHTVRCTRSRKTNPPKAGAESSDPAPAAPSSKPAKGRRDIVRVTYDKPEQRPDPQPEQRRDEPKPDDAPGAGPDPVPSPGFDQPSEHHSEQQSRRRNGTWRRRKPGLTPEQRRAAREERDERWIVPNIIPR